MTALSRVLVAAATVASFVTAQNQQITAPSENPVVVGEFSPHWGGNRAGGYGWAVVELESRSIVPLSLELAMEASTYRSTDFRASRHIELAPQQRTRIEFPLPTFAQTRGSFEIRSGGEVLWTNWLQSSARTNGPAILFVSDRSRTAETWRSELSLLSESFGSSKQKDYLSNFDVVTPDALPQRWHWLTGFDVVIVDGGVADLETRHQEVLRDHLVSGGTLMAVDVKAMGDGPLKDLLRPLAPPGIPTFGTAVMGQWCQVSRTEDLAENEAELTSWLTPNFSRAHSYTAAPNAGPVPSEMHETIAIPGLGRIPVRVFFVLILAFAIFVGPINHFIAHRRRQPLRMLFTVPAAGITCTVLLLAYGLWSEGFGTRGVIVSLTHLDQTVHRAVTTGSRTLYAGISPSQIEPGASTYLYSRNFLTRHRMDPVNPLWIDLDRNARINGVALPSRMPTAFATSSVDTCRARLRFERAADGSLRVLTGSDLVPVEGASSVWLISADGSYQRNRADGSMVATDRSELESWVKRIESDAGPAATAFRERLLGLAQPGTYVALVRQNPAVDDLGLTVDYDLELHVICGVLAEEDIVE